MWSLPTARRAIIVAGCLAMAYTQLTMSPATIQLARSLGATGLHIGILGALPAAMLFMQFVAAVVANHLEHRRRLWFGVTMVQRLAFLPLAVGPFLLSDVSDSTWLWLLVLTTAANHALMHFGTPLWLSWMGDYLPAIGLNHFWGVRLRWMQWTGALTLLAGSLFVLKYAVDIRFAFAAMIFAGALFGVTDLLFFLKVEEPSVRPAPEPALAKVLAAPFLEPGFRTFIWYTCFWHFAAMIGAPFISLYLLEYVGASLFQVLMLWTLSWVGGALLAGRLGHLAERFGNRPVLILCTALKSINMIALLLVPRQPELAFLILAPVFMVDAALNSGLAIATNGFLMKNSPAGNRTMFIAAGSALAGMVGGITSVVSGAVLAGLGNWQIHWGGMQCGGFHVLFATSMVLRVICTLFAVRIQEPQTHSTPQVLTQLIGTTPMRILRFPLGLYRGDRATAVYDSHPGPQALPELEPVEVS